MRAGEGNYTKTITVHPGEDVLIEGEETHGTGYVWGFGNTDCENQVIVGAIHKNQITKKREFPFTMVDEAVRGS